MAARKTLTCNSFVFYGSFYEAISVLPAENQAHIYDAIFKFAFENIEVELEGVEFAVFSLIRPQLVANRTKYENGCKGGRPPKSEGAENNLNETEQKPNENLKETEIKPNDNLTVTEPKPNENENVNDNVNVYKERVPERKATAFHPPSLEDVQKYITETGLVQVNAQHFIDFYESKGWFVGKNKMRDWKAAVRTWARRDKPDHGYVERDTVTIRPDVDNFDEVDI